MKCTVHPDIDATGFCRNCGRPLCPQCTRDVHGALYCEDCLGKLVAAPPATAATAALSPHAPQPGVALGLGFIPGLGAVYNGEYIKALIHVLIFSGLIAAQSSNVSGSGHAFLGVVLGCFYLYMPIEAYHTAKNRQLANTPAGAPGASLHEDSSSNFMERHRTPSGAIILIALGVFLLFANLGWLQWDWFSKAWPAALIALGAWMLVDRWRKA
jgi:Domain of unknown function (DUF5668)/B-box zinc finger